MHAIFVISILADASLGPNPLYLFAVLHGLSHVTNQTTKPVHLLIIVTLMVFCLRGNLGHLVLIGLFQVGPTHLMGRKLHLMSTYATIEMAPCLDLPMPVIG